MKKIHLEIYIVDHGYNGGHPEDVAYAFNSNDILELEDLLLDKKSCIHLLEIESFYQIDPFRIFKLLVRIIEENNGEIKEFIYEDHVEEDLSVALAIQLCDALRSNNNNTNNNNTNNNNTNNDVTIESFTFGQVFQNFEGLQHVWNALLETGVERLYLNSVVSKNDLSNDNMDFSNLVSDITLKELDLWIYQNQPNTKLAGTNIFESIMFNNTLEKFYIQNYGNDLFLENRVIPTYKEMLHKNSTLIDVRLDWTKFPIDLKKESDTHTEINRKWKRYKSIKREEENSNTTSATAATAATINDIDTTIVVNTIVEKKQKIQEQREKKIQEETKMKKKKEELLICLNEFHGKPVINNELIFSYLTNHSNSYTEDQLSIKRVEGIFEQTICLFDGTGLAPNEKLRVLKKLNTALTLSDHNPLS